MVLLFSFINLMSFIPNNRKDLICKMIESMCCLENNEEGV